MDQRAAKAFILAKLRAELPTDRTYHSFEHTLDVYASTITIAEMEGVVGEDLDLLKTAALFHDSGFLIQDLEHEEGSCQLVRDNLPRFGYSPEQVGRVCVMILSTKVPQDPQDHLARILCDADLDYLGRPDFFRIGSLLFAELLGHGSVSSEREWNRIQVSFLEKHHYFTATNVKLREEGKQAHLAAVRAWLAERE